MPPKKQLPQPIDRPLSRAYLRQFKGWSTAYPPGSSDPASMRVMENMLVNRDGSVRIRPGLRQLLVQPDGVTPGLVAGERMVGTHESFYLNDGRKAYLFAVLDTNEAPDRVEFRVGIYTAGKWVVHQLTDAGIAFDVSEWTTVPSFTLGTTYVKYVQIDNKILALSNNGEPLIVFHVGATKRVPKLQTIVGPTFDGTGASGPLIVQPDNNFVNGPQLPANSPSTPTGAAPANVLASGADDYFFAFFYTFSNELGESTPSESRVVAVQRGWGTWLWQTAAGPGNDYSTPSGVLTNDGRKAADQLVVHCPSGFDAAVGAGAKKLNLYMYTWSNQDSVPVEATIIASKDLTFGMTAAGGHSWIQVHPGSQFGRYSLPIPTKDNLYNASTPSKAAQGLVAADRLVLVNDPTAAAVIRWTTNEQGNYLDFTPVRGGGYKTLTSGNMQIPATVKLWQNPQSADTLTVLNRGTDGYSTAYYMMPASVSSQSDNVQIMGFEETTATPGTSSPFGCEVANNALYHPLDDQLMKSTASNYNINHKSMTDQIVNMWKKLRNKDRIVSCFFDQRIYFLVDNPDGAPVELGNRGNEVWVLDLAAEGGSWSRWTVPGCSLRKVELDGKEFLGLVTHNGVWVFDEAQPEDEYMVTPTELDTRPIYWRLETNTQGANRAHDAWSHLQQVSVTLGSFTGQMRYGIRGKNQHGMVVDVHKVYGQTDHELAAGDGLPFDAEDHLRIAHALKEWHFYASSVVEQVDEDFVVQPSFGQLTLVQYRYTPVSVNVGYDYGSVETFEYGGALTAGPAGHTDNGIPQPYLDTGRP